MQVPARVRVGDLRGEDPQQRVLLLDVLREREVRRLGAVRDVRVLLVRREQQLLHVVERHAEPGVQPARALEAVLEQLGVDEFADQRRRERAGVKGADLLLDLAADQPGGLLIEERLAHQRLDDALAGEIHHPLRGGAHEQRAVGGLLRRQVSALPERPADYRPHAISPPLAICDPSQRKVEKTVTSWGRPGTRHNILCGQQKTAGENQAGQTGLFRPYCFKNLIKSPPIDEIRYVIIIYIYIINMLHVSCSKST